MNKDGDNAGASSDASSDASSGADTSTLISNPSIDELVKEAQSMHFSRSSGSAIFDLD